MRAAALALVLAACSIGGQTLEQHPCPDGGTMYTYDTFGAPFFGRYCDTCHARSSETRNGAPQNVNFDTRDDVIRWRDRIFDNAAADNTSMPPGPNDPPAVERAALADWLACGAP